MDKRFKKQNLRIWISILVFFFIAIQPFILAVNDAKEQLNRKKDFVADANQYLVKLSLDQFIHSISGCLALNYTNKASKSFDELYFHLYPNAFKKNGGRVKVNQIKDEENKLLDYRIIGSDSTILKVKLAKPLKSGERTTIKMSFRIKIPRIKYRFGRWDNTYCLGNALPILCLYNQDGWNNDPYCKWGETFNSDFSFYKVSITVPKDFSVAATGSPIKTIHHKNSTKTIYYETGLVREFVFVASKSYEVISDSWEDITINSYCFPEHKSMGKEALNFAKRAIIDFSEHFGKYPYKEYNIAETYFGGGMEYPNLAMIGTHLYNPESRPILEPLIAHETAHQWWYCLVGNDQSEEPWLDEAFAVYSDVLYHEWEYGIEAGKDRLKLVRFGYYLWNGEERSPGESIRSFDPQSYEPIVYRKGACILDMLRKVVGDEKFYRILSTFFDQYKFKLTRIEDFIAIAEEIYGEELDWFFDEWLWSTGCTTYTIEDAQARKTFEGWELRINISQSNPSFKMPVLLEISLSNNKSKQISLWVDDERENLVLKFYSKPLYLVIDPHDDVLGIDEYNEKEVEILRSEQ
jgi:hypothetical protein